MRFIIDSWNLYWAKFWLDWSFLKMHWLVLVIAAAVMIALGFWAGGKKDA